MKGITHILFLGIISASLLPSPLFATDILGTWAYTVSDTPPEYAEGEITFKKDGDKYIATINVNDYITSIEEVTVQENRVSFKIDVEGSEVTINLEFDGDTMKGSALSNEGIFRMEGKRK